MDWGSPLGSRDSPLPRVIRLGSDASDEVTNWYVQTFSNELTEVKRSIKRVSDTFRSYRGEDDGDSTNGVGLGASSVSGSVLNTTVDGAEVDPEDVGSTVSSATATKLEIALMHAQEQAETQAKERDLLQTRLACLEEIEELRMQLAAFEMQLLLSAQAEQMGEQARLSPPCWARDEDHLLCQRCEKEFSFVRRRHHCRRCGKCFCADCAPAHNAAPIPVFGYYTPVRQCFDCLPPPGEAATTPRSRLNVNMAVSSANKSPYTSAIDGIRRLENACLRTPSSAAMVSTLQAYAQAIELIAKSEDLSDRKFRKHAHTTLLKSMHTFLEMPQIQKTLNEDDSSQAHDLLNSVLPVPETPNATPVKAAAKPP